MGKHDTPSGSGRYRTVAHRKLWEKMCERGFLEGAEAEELRRLEKANTENKPKLHGRKV